MRFSGTEVDYDPRDLPYGAATRFAGAVPVAYPELVDRIKASILPQESGSSCDELPDGSA
jgi:hypothetical protein